MSPTETVSKQSDNMNAATFFEQFKSAFVQTMQDAEGQEALRAVMKPLVQENTENITKLSQIVVKQQNKISDLEREVEMLKQQARNKTLIINGLNVDRNIEPAEQIKTLCKEKLSINLHPIDVDKAYISASKRNPEQKSIFITLTTNRKKDEIMRVKKNLKHIDNEKIFINEYLTLKQAETFAVARGLVKNKKLVAAWTRDGKVYVKQEENGQPKLILDKEQLHD